MRKSIFVLLIAAALLSKIAVAQITVTAPAAGTQWKIGSSQIVRWNTSGIMTLAKLKYSIDGGATWTTITGSAPNTGSYNWTVPNRPTSTARFAVMDTDGSPKAESGIFSIVQSDIPSQRDSLHITFPDGGESLERTTVQKITWYRQGSIPSVTIEFSIDDGNNWQIIDLLAANNGEYYWTVPDLLSPFARLRISDATDNLPMHTSLAFKITKSPARGDLRVSWNPNIEDDLAGYRVYFGNESREVAINYQFFKSTTDTTLILANLMPGTYYIAVTAIDFSGNESGFSDEVFGFIEDIDVDLIRPAIPTGVNVRKQ